MEEFDSDAVGSSLSNWWKENRVSYPWRYNRDEYSVLISETLLQHTSAESVSNVYDKFISTFPNWLSIVSSERHQLIDIIRPLGLSNQKSERLKQLASAIQDRGGVVPQSRKDIESLPGVGSYTANAIFSVSRGMIGPLLDVNMARVLNRLSDRPSKVDRDYWNRDPWLRDKSVEMFPMAEDGWMVIDFAKQICKPIPRCSVCPIREYCCSYPKILSGPHHLDRVGDK